MFFSRALIFTMVFAFAFEVFLAGLVYWCYRQARDNPDAMTRQGIPTTRRHRFQVILVLWMGYTVLIGYTTWRVFSTRLF